MIYKAQTKLILSMSAALALSACQSAATSAASSPVGSALSAEQAAAVDRAKQMLAEQGVGASGAYTVHSIEERQWSDSSLGCRLRGASYLQVISAGYAIKLQSAGKLHEVHVAGDNAVLCKDALLASAPRLPDRQSSRVTNLREMERAALTDLARRLAAPEADIRIVDRTPARWTQAAFECREGGSQVQPADESVQGFKLYLRHQARIYTYHTDMQRALPCPLIEGQ